jgi:cytochrome P450
MLTPEELAQWERREVFLFRDPPVHTRLRKLVSKAFTARRVEQLQPFVEKLTDELLTAAADRGRLELVADLAYPLPVAVISEMLGVPHEDHAKFAGWSAILAKGLDRLMSEPTPEEVEQNGIASDEFRAYFEDLAEQRRREPRDDLMSALVAAEEEGDRLTMDELTSTALLLLVAGHETTVSLIGNAMLALLRVPGLLDRVRDDPSVAEGVVEEVLRLDPPVQMTMRTALADVEVPGGVLKKGGTAVLLIAAANRDASAFADPLTLDPERRDTGHLAFGGGIHFCLGSPLARLEGRVVVAELARRLVAPRLEELTYRDNRVLRGPNKLVVGYDALLP